jgi:signal transduction histidine kinase
MKNIINSAQYHIKRFLHFREFNYTVLVFFLFTFIIGLITYANYKEMRDEKLDKMSVLSTNSSESIKLYVMGIFQKSTNYINSAEIVLQGNILAKKNLSAIEKGKILDDQLPDNQEFEILAITDENGTYIANSEWNKNHILAEKQQTVTLSDRKYFQTLKNNPTMNFVVSAPVISKSTGHWVIVFAKRRYHLENKFVGIELVTIATDKLSEYFKKFTQESDSSVALYDTHNNLLARFPTDDKKLGKTIPTVPELMPFINGDKASFIGFCPIDHIHKLYGFSNLQDLGLRILWGTPSIHILKPINQKFKVIVLLEAIIFLLAIYMLRSKFKNLETVEMLQIQESSRTKMAMIGEFASGIAHEVNNPLMIIIGNVHVLLNKKKPLEPQQIDERLTQIRETAERISKIVSGLKNLGHSSKSDEIISYKLQTVLDDVLQITNIKLNDNNVELKLLIDESIQMECVPSQLSQVFLNLFSNAIYAISTLEKKWIEIKTEVRGDKVLIHFTDSGNGIPLEIRNKLMNTHYTSKPIGVGTGLGLSICKKIIKQQGGDMYIADNVANTRFTIELKLTKV